MGNLSTPLSGLGGLGASDSGTIGQSMNYVFNIRWVGRLELAEVSC